MCGHATIALGRFLVDTHDLSIFPHRDKLPHDEATEVTTLRLHAPCGVVHVSVHTDDGHSDATRPVSFLGVPSFVTARDLEVDIPPSVQWKRLRDAQRSRVKVDIAYGGAFYALAAAALKRILAPRTELYAHPSEPDLEYLYSVMVQIDRSPTGSCVMARRLQIGEGRKYESI
ncbi:hypothetical protein B0H14DRAFT_3035221, partial [Mycena olivaceomarginata]